MALVHQLAAAVAALTAAVALSPTPFTCSEGPEMDIMTKSLVTVWLLPMGIFPLHVGGTSW